MPRSKGYTMAKYRIVKMKHYAAAYKVQEKIFGLFWVDTHWYCTTLSSCEWCIERAIETARLNALEIARLKKEYPRDIVVKTY